MCFYKILAEKKKKGTWVTLPNPRVTVWQSVAEQSFCRQKFPDLQWT